MKRPPYTYERDWRATAAVAACALAALALTAGLAAGLGLVAAAVYERLYERGR